MPLDLKFFMDLCFILQISSKKYIRLKEDNMYFLYCELFQSLVMLQNSSYTFVPCCPNKAYCWFCWERVKLKSDIKLLKICNKNTTEISRGNSLICFKKIWLSINYDGNYESHCSCQNVFSWWYKFKKTIMKSLWEENEHQFFCHM